MQLVKKEFNLHDLSHKSSAYCTGVMLEGLVLHRIGESILAIFSSFTKFGVGNELPLNKNQERSSVRCLPT